MLLVVSCVIVRLPNVSGASVANPDMGALVQAVLRNIRNLHLEPTAPSHHQPPAEHAERLSRDNINLGFN